MHINDIRTLYDQDQRINATHPSARREVTAEVVRHVNLTEHEPCFVIHSRVDEVNADRVIRAQIAFFATQNRPFEWKVFDYDTPPDLVDRLAAHGFEIDDPEAILVLDLTDLPTELTRPIVHDVRRITRPEGIRDLTEVENQVWGRERPGLEERLIHDLIHFPDLISIYVAYVDDRPVAGAWIYFDPGSRFASLWGGSTLTDFRGMGIYTDLIALRAQEALARGRKFLTVDASPMSRPILERRGFRCIGMARACMKEI
ncbi:MAG: GNAT family N-acetyltransferase [Caldilineaceae bacterium]|nr:GNAT family N-acetyltransferase [Caldilineaceae bacterium]MBP8108539.1 GNAT family N-acetyltransferase [Caldilineaceae bacterium]MBP8123525.1 GNAT family N-acetyltransferase [Caldilineaceae bacterium]MBP9074818.1 GNAT family N-acetyltransferase [Caldilineaceae bacterium]